MRFSCQLCESTFSTSGNLTKHNRVKHGVVKYEYECECGRKFDNPQSLNSHYRYCLVHRKCKPPITLKGRASPFKGKTLDEISSDPTRTRLRLSQKSMGRVVTEEFCSSSN
jgi:uncharacterized Zn-finger protein